MDGQTRIGEGFLRAWGDREKERQRDRERLERVKRETERVDREIERARASHRETHAHTQTE